ncbi:MAG: hypothetical protein HQK96_16810 [Nitrospirae bacterium]|nr:hypothetical protein [Nitrospirota bacterium]
MTTNLQIEANKKNALESTGPKTENGKAIASKNAVKIGIYTKDILLDNENIIEYQELLSSFIDDLHPEGQTQTILVENIAVNYWRLKRVWRYEAGSISEISANVPEWTHSDNSLENGSRINHIVDLNKKIKEVESHIAGTCEYMNSIKAGCVRFDVKKWTCKGITRSINASLAMVLEKLRDSIFDDQTGKDFDLGKMVFEDKLRILRKKGYDDSRIGEVLIQCLEEQAAEYCQKMDKITGEKESQTRLLSLPGAVESEKIMRYEAALQNSIAKSLSLLKKLQSIEQVDS